MKICVIGGSGFVGTRLCSRLEKAGIDFYIIDKNPRGPFVDRTLMCDIRDGKTLSGLIEGDVIINLAAEHRDDVRPVALYDEVNVGGSANICKIAAEKKIQNIIFTSSVAVYGFAEPGTDEEGKINPFNDYGRTKWEAEQVYDGWFDEDPASRSLVILRPTVIFGEGNRGNVFNLLNQIHSRRFIMIGRGTNRKSMAYVENVAACIQHFLHAGVGRVLYNYVDKPDMTVNELVINVRTTLFAKGGVGLRLPKAFGYVAGAIADFVAAILRRNLAVSSIRIKKFLSDTQFDTDIASTGFKAPISLAEGLRKTLQYEFIEDNSGKQVFYTE